MQIQQVRHVLYIRTALAFVAMTKGCVDLSRGTAYGVALSQMAICVGCVLFFPAVKVQVFLATPNVINGTLGDAPPVEVSQGRLLLGGPILVFSALTVYFSLCTLSLQENGKLEQSDYCSDGIEQTGVWNAAFWLAFSLQHCILVLILTSPCDFYAAALCACFLAYFAYRSCAPNPAGYTQTQANLNMMGYAFGAIAAYRNIPGGSPNRSGCLAFFIMIDCFMGMGHAWDRQATLDTVANCRLFYVCASSLGLCLIYAFWWDWLRIPA